MSLQQRYIEQQLLAMTGDEFSSFRKGKFLETGLVPEVSHFSLGLPDGVALGGDRKTTYVSASDFSPQQALLKAYYEGLERQALGFANPKEVLSQKCFSDLQQDFHVTAPEEWALCSEEQYRQNDFPLVPFTASLKTDWVPVRHAWKEGPAVVPFSLAHYTRSHRGSLYTTSTSGSAFHWSIPQAQDTALLELIERDTLLMHWRRYSSGETIQITDPQRESLKKLWMSLRGKHDQIKCLLLRNEFNIPVVAALFFGKNGEIVFQLSTAAHYDIERALEKALMEMIQVLTGTQRQSSVRIDEPTQVKNFIDHVFFYNRTEVLPDVAFLHEQVQQRTLSQLKKETWTSDMPALLAKMKALNYDVYFKDYYSPELQLLGGHVVRALCPALIPLDYNHAFCALGGARLKQGLRDEKLNPLPHPLP